MTIAELNARFYELCRRRGIIPPIGPGGPPPARADLVITDPMEVVR